jgi:S1-C subfamily serine protease
MEIRCRCSACQAKFKVDGKYAGKKARCPKCQQIVDVPLESVEGSTVSSFPTVGGSQPAGPGTGIGNSAIIPPKSVAPRGSQSATFPKPAATAPLPGQSAVFAKQPEAAAPLPSAGFPNLNLTTTRPATGGPAAQPTAATQRKKFKALPLIIGGGVGVAILAAVGIALLIAMNQPVGGDGKAGETGGNAAPPAATDATLVIDLAEVDRRSAGLAINGRKEPIPGDGEVKFTLPPGEHKILLQRRGFEPIEQSVTLARGASAQITPEWRPSSVAGATPPAGPATTIPPAGTQVNNPPGSTDFPVGTGIGSLTPAGFEGFVQNLELAKRQAQAGKKDILIVFACSDADRETQALASGLKTAQATQSLVGVVIDFPRSSEAFNLVEDRGQNEQMLDDFGVKSLPTVVLTDDQGRAYFYKHEWDDGFDGLAAKLTQWQQQRSEVQQLLTETQSGDGAARLAAAAKAVKWVQDHKVWRSYGPEFTKWLNQAQQLDPENKQALLEVFFEPQWLIHSMQVNEEDSAAVSRVASLLDPWVARKFQDQDRGAKLHMTAAFLLAEVEQYDAATAQIEHAVKYQPKDAKLAEALADVKRRLENKDILGSGSGYLISSAGYVLTNHHVIEGEGRIEIRVPGTKDTVPAELIAQDAERDIALLKVAMPGAEKYQPIALAAEPVRRGAAVAAFGFPKGDTLGTGLKFTSGTISALPDEANDQMYLLDVTINPGNSGGPLCDRRGNVVGMITAKTLNDGFEDSYGLAVPTADLIKFLDQHLPAEAPRVTANSEGSPLDWDQVDEKVSSGVLMILKKK